MEILREFGIQPILLLAQIVNFLIILWLLKKFFYRPIAKILEDRQKRIDESLKNAALIGEKLRQTDQKSAEILQVAQRNAQDLIADAKKEAQRISYQASQDARKTVEETVEKAKVQIEAERHEMQKQLEQQTLNLVVEVTKKVLGKTLKANERRQLTSRAVLEIERQVS